jgi:uridine kinase
LGTEKPFVIGITGGSASGKTLFLKSLLNKFSEEEITLISQDNYYKDRSEMPVDKNGYYNFDLPECIDFQLYSEHIQALIDGETVTHKEYQFDNSESRKDLPEVFLTYKPSKIIVVEGLFVFYKKKVSKLLDLKIFVDAKEHIKLKRRINRDKNERGSDLEDVLYRWEKHVAPTFDKYINPTKHKADIIVNNHKHFSNALDIMTVFIESKLKA